MFTMSQGGETETEAHILIAKAEKAGVPREIINSFDQRNMTIADFAGHIERAQNSGQLQHTEAELYNMPVWQLQVFVIGFVKLPYGDPKIAAPS